MTFVMSAMYSYMMYFIVAPAARRRLSNDHLVMWLWNRMGKSPYFMGSIYTLYVCTRTP